MSRFFSRNPPFVKIGEKAKSIVKENNKKIKEINLEIQRLFDRGLDTSGLLRKELAKDRRLLMVENTDIKKGYVTIADNDTSAENVMNRLYNKEA